MMTFQIGISGNPSGRPRGTGNRQQLFSTLVEPYKEALFKVAIDMALKGNESMLRLFLDRMLPAKPSDEPIQIDVPDRNISHTQAISYIGKEVLQAVTAGVITPDEATRVSALIGANARLMALVELDQRLNALEEKE